MLEPKEILQILLSEYSFIKNEMKTYIELFHKQTNFVTLYLSIIAGILSINISWFSKNLGLPAPLLTRYILFWPLSGSEVFAYQIISFFIYVLLAVVGFYFLIATLSYIYIIEVLARRISVIERNINKLADRDIMTWELSISPYLIRSFVHKKLWMSPSTIRIVMSLVLLGVILAIQVFTASELMGSQLALLFIIAVCFFSLFFVIQMIYYGKVAIPYYYGIY
jgi:hypothetical protein